MMRIIPKIKLIFFLLLLILTSCVRINTYLALNKEIKNTSTKKTGFLEHKICMIYSKSDFKFYLISYKFKSFKKNRSKCRSLVVFKKNKINSIFRCKLYSDTLLIKDSIYQIFKKSNIELNSTDTFQIKNTIIRSVNLAKWDF